VEISNLETQEATSAEIRKWLAMPDWTPKQRLALACRILASEGHVAGLSGQITLRAKEGGYWTLPLGLGFDEAIASIMIRIDDNLRLLHGAGMPHPAVRLHLAIYRARPDVTAIIHTQPPYCSALSMIGQPLVVSHMDSAMLYDECAHLAEWPEGRITEQGGEAVARTLGSKRAILLAHHGQLSVGGSIAEATYLAINIERAARMQLRAQGAGLIKSINKEHARDIHDFLLTPEIVNAAFNHFARRVIRQSRGEEALG
jgi:L-fuculose-phosphate aldolase